MRRIGAIMLWDVQQGLRNRFMRVFALACLGGGSALLAAAPGREVLPMLLIQAILLIGSLFAMLIGWGNGQQTRAQGPFLFAQPVSAGELIVGQLLGTGGWCLLLLLLFMSPAALRAGMPQTLAALAALGAGLVLVCVLGGLVIGLAAPPVSGLLAVLLAWLVAVAGWEVGLLLLTETTPIVEAPELFIGLLLLNPAGTFRIAAMVGLEAVPFDAEELQSGRLVFEHVGVAATAIFAGWLALLLGSGIRAVSREER
ncbi:MAG: hypothetical protein ACOC9T_01315 [Myxococcota bacterium]